MFGALILGGKPFGHAFVSLSSSFSLQGQGTLTGLNASTAVASFALQGKGTLIAYGPLPAAFGGRPFGAFPFGAMSLGTTAPLFRIVGQGTATFKSQSSWRVVPGPGNNFVRRRDPPSLTRLRVLPYKLQE